jgi:hypothetical protein
MPNVLAPTMLVELEEVETWVAAKRGIELTMQERMVKAKRRMGKKKVVLKGEAYPVMAEREGQSFDPKSIDVLLDHQQQQRKLLQVSGRRSAKANLLGTQKKMPVTKIEEAVLIMVDFLLV